MRRAIFGAVSSMAARRPWTVILTAVSLTVVALVVAARIEVKTSFNDTMDQTDPIAVAQKYLEDNFRGAYSAVVAIEGRDKDRMISVAEQMESKLLEHPDLVRGVYLRTPVEFLVRHGLLFFPPDDIRMLDGTASEWQETGADLLADPSILGLLGALEQVGSDQFSTQDTVTMLTSRTFGRTLLDQGPWESMGMELGVEVDTEPVRQALQARYQAMVRETPLPPSEPAALTTLTYAGDMLELVADVLDEGEAIDEAAFRRRVDRLRELDFAAMGGLPDLYRFSPDGSMLMMEVTGVPNIGRIDEGAPFVQLVRDVADEISLMSPDVAIGLTGAPVMIQEETVAIVDNFVLISVLAFLGVLAVFIIGFERVGLPSLAAIPLLMGISWTAGIQAAWVGELNMFTLIFPVLLASLGIDFAIHILSAYAAERDAGLEIEAAFVQAFDRIGAGLVTGAVTTAAAFGALMISDYPGISGMGFIAMVGVITALIAMVVVLPAVLVLHDRRLGGRGETLPNVPFPFLGTVASMVQRHRYPVLAVFMAATIFFAYFAQNVGMDRNLMNLEPLGMASVEVQDRVLEKFQTSSEMVAFMADDLDQVREIHAKAEASDLIASVLSVAPALPLNQEAKAVHINAFAARLQTMEPDAERPIHTYDAAELEQLRERVGSMKSLTLNLSLLSAVLYGDETQAAVGRLRDLVNRIERRITPAAAGRLRYLDELLAGEIKVSWDFLRDLSSNDSLTAADLPPALGGRLRGEDGKWLIIASAAGDVWDEAFLSAYVRELNAIHPNLAGFATSWHHMLTMILSDLPRIVAVTVLVVFLIVLADLRSLRGAVLALVPLFVGIIWTVGVMGLFGIDFNVNSVMAMSILVGIGIDDGVHVYHRIRLDRRLDSALSHSGKAVVLTSLTTGLGFGSLILSVHQGMYGLGLVTTIGIFMCLLLSLVLLPALVSIFDEDLLRPVPGPLAPGPPWRGPKA